MKKILFAVIVTLFAATSMASTHHKHHTPKHRYPWELYSIQGLYSKQNCPGQYIEWIYQDDGTRTFLGCWGKKDSK
jgi:hypothetical protein